MKKIIFLFFVLALSMTTAMAETASTVYSYAGDDVFSWGKGKTDTYDIAMCLNDPSLAGMKITGLSALINTPEQISDVSLWLTSELKLENKVNVVDIIRQEAVPVPEGNDGWPSLSRISVTFDEPYILTDKPVYAGYSFNVDNNATDELRYPVIVSTNINPNGLYVHISKSVLQWLDYSENVGGSAAIYVTLEGDFPSCSLEMKSLESGYSVNGEDFEVIASLMNTGVETVTDIDYTCSVGEESYDMHFDLPYPLVTDMAKSTNISLPVKAIEGDGANELTLTINKVNGKLNEASNTSSSTTINVLPFIAVHRPLIEEYTGTWCQWCIRGWKAMELIREMYGDKVIRVAFHSDDPMEVAIRYPLTPDGYPAATIDRGYCMDPYYGTGNLGKGDFSIRYDLDEAIQKVVPAEINVEAIWADEEKTKIDVSSSVRFIDDREYATYLVVGYMLVADGLTGTENSWMQANGYAKYAGTDQLTGTYLDELSQWPYYVPDLVFNDVAINVSGQMGIIDSLPATIIHNEWYDGTYSFDIADNPLVQDKDKLSVVSMIVNRATGEIVNANKAHVVDIAGVEAVATTPMTVSTRYYDLCGMCVANPTDGNIYIKVDSLSDGTVTASKVIFK